MTKKIDRLLDVISKEDALNMLLLSVRTPSESNAELDVMIDASFEVEWRYQFSDKEDINPLLIKEFINQITYQSPWIKEVYNESKTNKMTKAG